MKLSKLRHVFTGAAALLIAAMSAIPGATDVKAASIKIVALGASDLAGRHVVGESWATKLEQMLRAKGYDVSMTVSATPGLLTAQVLEKVDSAVPIGTQVVVFSSGGINDRIAGVPIAQSLANVAQIKSRIRARGAVPIQVAPGKLPSTYKQADGIHPTDAGQAVVAAGALPQVIAALGKRK